MDTFHIHLSFIELMMAEFLGSIKLNTQPYLQMHHCLHQAVKYPSVSVYLVIKPEF
jgi:hypothetical protein